uniref:ATP synthase F0 subunit 9 n=1 Tax=Cladonia ravenelii TaxID=195782 RepID=UPI0022FD8CD0|nr:ATP synthase F0 subunit 9 [Cladonia ravenelii]WBP63523.1 ATP synthase F0 subunit 9 [Cladonia ravenelii]
MIQAAKILGTGMATTGLIGAGVGIGVVIRALILSVARNPTLRGQLFAYAILGQICAIYVIAITGEEVVINETEAGETIADVLVGYGCNIL